MYTHSEAIVLRRHVVLRKPDLASEIVLRAR